MEHNVNEAMANLQEVLTAEVEILKTYIARLLRAVRALDKADAESVRAELKTLGYEF